MGAECRRDQQQEAGMTRTETNRVATKSAPAIEDSGKVRIGATSPSFPLARATPRTNADSGKVRIGATSPSFPLARATPRTNADSGKVQIGAVSPNFPPAR
jgi:hypothetical protein